MAAEIAVQIAAEQLDELYMIEEAGEVGLVLKLIESFASKSPESINKIKLARDQGDHSLLEAVAHSFKSSAALLGAQELAMVCSELEMGGHDRAAFPLLNEKIESLQGLAEASVTELRRIVAQRAA